MADVSVEFGAKDTGLEQTLKTVQEELTRLGDKVKTGELSMTELESTMKRIGQVEGLEKKLKAMGDQSAESSPKVDSLGNSIKSTGDKTDKMGDQAGIGFGKLASAVGVGQLAAQAFTAALDAAFSAVKGTIDGFRDALNLGGTLSDLSASTGETAGNLLLLQRAFDNTGAGADAVGPALARLQNSIFGAGEDSKAAASAFGRMGISMEEMAGKTPTEQLALVASGISGIEDPAARAATAIDIFGKSGAQLLPLLTNFSSEMNDARATVGSLAEIMDRRANVFDAVSDRFVIISQKVRDFAAGILDRALPAIDAITSALSRIDAAAIGQKLADSFLGGENAMKGFQAAVDAISIGNIDLAFKAFYESLKLQAMQTAESIYKHLVAGFQTAGQAAAAIFSEGSATMKMIESGFFILGQKISMAISEAMLAAMPKINLFKPIYDNLKQNLEGMQAAQYNNFKQFQKDGVAAAEEVGSVIAQLPGAFESNYSKIPPLFANMTEQQQAVAAAEAQIAEQVKITTAERANQSAQTEAELAARQALKDQQAAADAQAKADKVELITLETQINEAISAGNTELAKSLEKELETKKAKEEIAKLTKEYVKNLGVSEEEAGKLATNFVNAKNAAAGVHVDKTSITSAKNEASEAATAARSFATWLDYIKGIDPTDPVKSLKERTREARNEITAFGDYIGVDLKNLSYPDILKKLKIDSIATTGSGQLEEIMKYIDQQRGELLGLNPVDESGSKKSVDSIKTKIEESLGGKQTITFDATESISSIKEQLKESIDLALSSSKGSEFLGEIRGFVETIKDLVQKIEPKLPMQALSY